MGISEFFGKAYMKVEDGYYSSLDFLEEKGLGFFWSINDSLESKGVPALPVILSILFLLLAGITWVFVSPGASGETTLSFSVKDDKGNALQNVKVQIFDEQGNFIREAILSDGGQLTLKGINSNSKLQIKAEKEGFENDSIVLRAEDEQAFLSLKGENDVTIGKLKIVDSETQTTIRDVLVTAEWENGIIPATGTAGEDGVVLLEVPLKKEILITVKADNYEDLTDTIIFSNSDVKIKQLTPKLDAQKGESILVVKGIDSKTQAIIENIHIKIENAQTGETITGIQSGTGVYTENLSKGQVVRVTVEKEGYLSYSSNISYPEGITLRKTEETVLAVLSFGGAKLYVLTQNGIGGNPLQNVEVTLLDENKKPIQTLTSSFSGESIFEGLNETKSYFLLAYHPSYFPLFKNIEWNALSSVEDGKKISMEMQSTSSKENGILTVFVSNSDGTPSTKSIVSIYDRETGNPVLLQKKVDNAGSFTIRLPIGEKIELVVESEDGLSKISETIVIQSGLNKSVLTLDSFNEKKLTIQYPDGTKFNGTLVIESLAGDELFDETITNGEATLDAGSSKTVRLFATDSKGKTIEQTVNVEGKTITVTLGGE